MVSIGILVGESEAIISCEKIGIIRDACRCGPCYARDRDSAFIKTDRCGYVLIGSSGNVIAYCWDDRCFVDPMYRCCCVSGIPCLIGEVESKTVVSCEGVIRIRIIGYRDGFVTTY